MRKRVLGGGAVIILLVGMWMGNFFQGFGLGTGGGNGSGEDEGDPGRTQVSLTTEQPPAEPPESEPSQISLYSDEVLTVLVTGTEYQVETESTGAAAFEPATLEEIVSRAEDMPGDRNGIRVRLRFSRTAESGATSDLYERLQAAGIEREAILETTGYID